MSRLKHWEGFGVDHPLSGTCADLAIEAFRETADNLEKLQKVDLEKQFDDELGRVFREYLEDASAYFGDEAGQIEIMIGGMGGPSTRNFCLRSCFGFLIEPWTTREDMCDDVIPEIGKWADYLEGLAAELRKFIKPEQKKPGAQ